MNEVQDDRADPSLTFCRFVSVYRIDATKVRGPWRVGMSQIQWRVRNRPWRLAQVAAINPSAKGASIVVVATVIDRISD